MKKWILLLAVLFTSVQLSYAAEPIMELPPQPTGEQLELFEDSDELFALELMKYYNYALTYQIQYMLYNPVDTDIKRVPDPTLEQITDAEAKVHPNGLSAAGAVGKVLIWSRIDESQTPNYTTITDTQTSSFSEIDETQTPSWQEVA